MKTNNFYSEILKYHDDHFRIKIVTLHLDVCNISTTYQLLVIFLSELFVVYLLNITFSECFLKVN